VVTVLALTAGTVLAAHGHQSSTRALVAAAHPKQVRVKTPRAAARTPGAAHPVAGTAHPAAGAAHPTTGAATGTAARYDAIWATAWAHHPEPTVYAGTEDRGIDCDHLKCIALTFDDGPGSDTTDGLLETLAVEHVRATFFVVGSNVRADPGPMIRAAWDGHEIGIHTWDHRALPGRPLTNVADDITRTADEITRRSGVRPDVLRPPYGAIDSTTGDKIPYPVIIWSVDPDDWRDHNANLVASRVISAGTPGSIVLMHDVYPTTVAAVPQIIAFYKAHNYTFVTVSELYNSRLRAHHVYRGREQNVAAARAKDAAAHIERKPWIAPELRTDPTTEAPVETAPEQAPEQSDPGAPPTDPSTEPTTGPVTSPPPQSSDRRS